MNTKLYKQTKDALYLDNPKLRGYKNLSRADIEMVLMCVDAMQPLRFGSTEAKKLYSDIVGE